MKQFAHIAQQRQALLAEYPDRGEQVAALRGNIINQIEALQKQADETLAGKGVHVYHAQNAEEAKKWILELCQDAHKVCRINSPELAEVGFDQIMTEAQKPVVMTDIGEIIGKEAGLSGRNGHRRLSMLEGLAQEEIVAALQRFVGSEDVAEPQSLAQLTKQVVRSEIIASDFGVTGIDAIVAENGTIVLAENEGNGRMVSNLPYRHLVVAGIDKLYDTAENAMDAIQTANIYGLGKRNATYYSYISGQSRTADIEFRMVYGMHGPLEVHVILLDNGRSELIKKGCGNVLKCIDCGACYESLSKVADRNGWQDILLTAKNVALKAVRKELGTVQGVEELAEFPCPAGVTTQDIVKAVVGS